MTASNDRDQTTESNRVNSHDQTIERDRATNGGKQRRTDGERRVADGGVAAASVSESAEYDTGSELTDVLEKGDPDLRAGADDCYKCTACDTSCPIAEVDEEFPGPKFQGPEQWQLKRKDDADIDDSVISCSNCMCCDSAHPSSVPFSQMHNKARGKCVSEQMSTPSREYVRSRILANYRTSAAVASAVLRLANFAMGFGPARWAMEKLLGTTAERDFPEFASQTFQGWWRERDGARVENPEKRAAYFHGCYANHNAPEVTEAMIRVFEQFGYEVLVPPQGCSGTPMFANGMLGDARRHAEADVEHLATALVDGADIIASCTSCSPSLRQEYPELFDTDDIEDVSDSTFEALEYLRIHGDLRGVLTDAELDGESFGYHGSCHARNQGLYWQVVELFRDVDDVEIEDVGDSCSSISRTYDWKEEKYDKSMKIGEEMFDHMRHAEGDAGIIEYPTRTMQMEHGTGYEIRHPLELLGDALAE